MSATAAEDLSGSSAPASDLALRVDDVAVHYGGVKAVDGISLELRPNKIYGILGPNGSGKSTLIGAISRHVKLTRGSIAIGGDAIEHSGPRQAVERGLARTFQTVRLVPELTTAENVMTGSDSWAGARQSVEAASAAMDRVGGLKEVRNRYPLELSYGTQRRVEIARAIAMRPSLLLLDEPTAGMNSAERREISRLLTDLKREFAILLIEHDVEIMVSTCDYLFAMNSGRLIAQGKPQTVVADEGFREAYLGKRGRRDA